MAHKKHICHDITKTGRGIVYTAKEKEARWWRNRRRWRGRNQSKQDWTDGHSLRCCVKFCSPLTCVSSHHRDLRHFKTSINSTKPANLLVQPAVFLCLLTALRSEFLDALHWTGCQQADNYYSLVFLILSHMKMINARAQQPFHGHLSLSPIVTPKDAANLAVLRNTRSSHCDI